MKLDNIINLKGFYTIKKYDKVSGLLLKTMRTENLIMNEFKDFLLGVMFKSALQADPWYIIPVVNSVAPAASMTYALKGFTEGVDYDEVTRPEFVDGTIAGQAINNLASPGVMIMNASGTLYGIALVTGSSTKNDSAATPAYMASYSLLSVPDAYINTTLYSIVYSMGA